MLSSTKRCFKLAGIGSLFRNPGESDVIVTFNFMHSITTLRIEIRPFIVFKVYNGWISVPFVSLIKALQLNSSSAASTLVHRINTGSSITTFTVESPGILNLDESLTSPCSSCVLLKICNEDQHVSFPEIIVCCCRLHGDITVPFHCYSITFQNIEWF